MRKLLLLSLSTALLICTAGCAPKIKHEEQNKNTQTVQDSPHVYEAITLYFPDKDGTYLVKETREVALYENQQLETILLQELFKGPKGHDLQPSVRGDVRILSVETKMGLCTVDLSKTFTEYNNNENSQEPFAVQSIVHSLCTIDEIDRVKINIEGSADAEFSNGVKLSEPISPNPNILLPPPSKSETGA